MKNLILTALIAVLVFGCKDKVEKNAKENIPEVLAETKVDENAQEGWTVLFDGTSFDGWKGYLTDEVSEN
ncbi:Putative secreted glycosyl hydrolase [hydrothermal vent metagenome]|uniref:Secreted glycosyl hydrolase n=1 Tax=hydrothermal vent metagenome TaxID=652676 RepID=A0A3B0SV74_9ZZZZ